MRLLSLTLLAALLALTAAGATIPALTPARQDYEGGWWTTRHNLKMQQIAQLGNKIDVALLGDSITHFMEDDVCWTRYFCGKPYTGVDLGFGGDRTENLLWRIQNGEIDGYYPKCFMIMIGTNNTGSRGVNDEPPCDTMLGVMAAVDYLRAKRPKAKVILCSISPRDQSPGTEYRKRNETINKELEKFCDGRNIIWCDWGNQMLDPAGRLPADMCYDALHPTAKGYAVWMRNCLPLMAMCCSTNEVCPCTLPVSRSDEAYWASIAAMRDKVAGTAGQKFDVALLGDDLLEGFYSVAPETLKEVLGSRSDINLALKGDKVQNVAWRAANGELHSYDAGCILISAGGANTADVPGEVAAGVRALLASVRGRQAGSKLVVTGVMPFGRESSDPARQWSREVNGKLSALADGTSVFFLDPAESLLEEDGTLKEEVSPDGVSLSKEGYARFGSQVKAWLDANL